MVSSSGMPVSLKTDLRFPITGQQGHRSRNIQEDAVLSDNITTASVPQGAEPGKLGINEAIAAVNDSREEKIPFSAAEIKIESVPEECVYVSIDDIGVKHQKDSRKEGSVRDYKP